MYDLFHYYFLIDLCSSDHLPEVEIFSLLEEQIPKYKLRADTLTQFAGYQNEVSKNKFSDLYEIIDLISWIVSGLVCA